MIGKPRETVAWWLSKAVGSSWLMGKEFYLGMKKPFFCFVFVFLQLDKSGGGVDNIVNVLNASKLCTLKWLILC